MSVITIVSLTNSGLFKNTKLAKGKYFESVKKEENILSQTEDYIANYRASGDIITKSLINKNDGIYNKSERGYLFSISTSAINYKSNNIIKLNESLEEYKFLCFDFDIYDSIAKQYIYFRTEIFSTDRIKENYNNTDIRNSASTDLLSHHGSWYSLLFFWAKDANTIAFQDGMTTIAKFTQFRVVDIKGIK